MKKFIIVALCLSMALILTIANIGMACPTAHMGNTAIVRIDQTPVQDKRRSGGRRQRFGARHHRRRHRRHRANTHSTAAKKAKKWRRAETRHTKNGRTRRRRSKPVAYNVAKAKATIAGAIRRAAAKAAAEQAIRDQRPLCPSATAANAALRWPTETVTPKRAMIWSRVARIALLPVTLVLGIGFGHMPELPSVEEWQKKYDDALSVEQAAKAKMDALVELIDDAIEVANEAAEDRIIVAELAVAEARANLAVAKATLTESRAAKVAAAEAVTKAEEAIVEFFAVHGSTSDAAKRQNATTAARLKATKDDAAAKLQVILDANRGKYVSISRIQQEKAARTAYAKAKAAYDAHLRAAAANEEMGVSLIAAQEEALREYESAKAEEEYSEASINVAYRNIAEAIAAVKAAKHTAKETKNRVKAAKKAAQPELITLRAAWLKAKDKAEGVLVSLDSAKRLHDEVDAELKTHTVISTAKWTYTPAPVQERKSDYAKRVARYHAAKAVVKANTYVEAINSLGEGHRAYSLTEEDMTTEVRNEVLDAVKTEQIGAVLRYTVCKNGSKQVYWYKRTQTKWELLKDLASIKSAKVAFSQTITKQCLNWFIQPLGGADYRGHGSIPPAEVVVKDVEDRVIHFKVFASKEMAREYFKSRSANAALCGVFTAQLFEDGVLKRHTGDLQELSENDGVITKMIVLSELKAAGVTQPRAEKIAEYFGVETRRGEGDLCEIVEAGDLTKLTAINGIGKATAQKAVDALRGKLRPYQEITKPEPRYVDVLKIINDGVTETQKLVHVKYGQLGKHLNAIIRAKGEKPEEKPAYIYLQQEVNRKLKEEDKATARSVIRDLVITGVTRFGEWFRHTLHGTNAAKSCTMLLVREDLIPAAIGFCLADANPKAAFTAAKRMAYMGLKLVGTDDTPFVFKAEWVYVAPDVHLKVADRKIMVEGKTVYEVEDGEVDQNAFDGAAIMHFSNKLKQEIIDSCKTAEEKAATIEWFKSLDSHTGRVLPLFKGMNVVCFDIHKFYAERGITHLPDSRAIEDVCLFTTKSVFKGSIGPNGTHASWDDFCKACAKYGYRAGAVLHAHACKQGDLSSQQIQTLSGISKKTVKELVAAALKNANAIASGEGIERLVGNKKLADLLRILPQMAAEESIAKRLNDGWDRIRKIGLCGKLYGEATSAFAFPDPIALATWIIYQDRDKIEYSIGAWNIVIDDPMFKEGQEVVISRNPCTDLSGLCIVKVRKSFGKYQEYFTTPFHVCFCSVLDTTATRLRMDYDGDHVVISGSKELVKAVKEAIALWYPGEARHPVIDWVAPEGQKHSLSDEEILEYFCGRTDSDPLGVFMDYLTMLYSTITCDAKSINPLVKKAVAWLTYAVNVLVDASKHGGEQIKLPYFVKNLLKDVKMAKAVADSKAEDGKEVDWTKVQETYSNGILDVVAALWNANCPIEFRMFDCDYNAAFDPTVLLSEMRAEHKAGENLRSKCMLEFSSIVIHNLVGDDHWHFYPYLKDKDGHVTGELAAPGEWLKFGENGRKVRFESMDELNACPVEKRENLAMVKTSETTRVLRDIGELIEDGKPVVKADVVQHVWEEVPGKWLASEAEQSETAKDPTITPFFQILEGKKEEIEEAYAIDGDKNDKEKAAADRAKMRKYLAWSALQSLEAYGAIYGADTDEICDKILIWALRPRTSDTYDKDGSLVVKGEKKVNPLQLDFFFDVFGKLLIERAERINPLRNVVMVQFKPGEDPYTYLTEELLKKGDQVVVTNARGERQILDVIAAGQRRQNRLDAYAKRKNFTSYAWAEKYATAA